MQQFEQAPVPEDIKDNNLRPLTITLDPVTEANGSITVVTEDERITEDMKPISIEVGTPETFKAPITVATASETATLTCPNAVGSSTVKVTFVKTSPVEGGYDYPPAVTSTEFDILADRIGSLSTLTTTAKTSAVDAINELDSDISTLNSNIANINSILATGIRNVKSQVIAANGGTLSISSTVSDDIYIVAIGGWNYSQLFVVMTANGSAPKKIMIASYSSGSTSYPVSANGSWGFTITNDTAYPTNCNIYAISKKVP